MSSWIEKQRCLIDFTAASLARRKAKNVGLLLVYAALVFVLASVMLFSHALRHEAARLLEHSPEIVLQRMVAGRHDLVPPGYIEKIGALRGVQNIEGRLWGYYYDPLVKANYTFMVTPSAKPDHGSILIGAAVARTRGLNAGDALSLSSYSGKPFTFKIGGILSQSSELVSADLVILGEDDFRAFFAIPPGHFTDIVLSVANPQEVRNIAAKLASALPDSRPILRDEVQRTYAAVFDWREGMVLVVLFAAVFAFAILCWDKASGLSAEERFEIGVLKAIGWETGDVIAMKFWEGLLISLTAFLIGFVAAYLHVFRFSAPLFEPALKGWSVMYPRFALVPDIDAMQVATLAFFTVFPYAVAVLVPIWRAAITDPDAVMR